MYRLVLKCCFMRLSRSFSIKMLIQHFVIYTYYHLRKPEVFVSHFQIPAVKVNYRQKDQTSEHCAHPAFVPLHVCPRRALSLISPQFSTMWPQRMQPNDGMENKIMSWRTTQLSKTNHQKMLN